MISAFVAGVFLSFSDFTMRSLRLATPEAGSQAMQIINREVFRSIFIVLLMGMSLLAVFGAAAILMWPPRIGAPSILAGCLVYVLGVFAVTAFGNVPKNEKLAAFPDGSSEAQAYWPTYYNGWIFWNHIRTFFSGVSAILFLVSALQQASAGIPAG